MNCVVCEGSGFVNAAPVRVVAVWVGSVAEPECEPVAAWDESVVVPCFACVMKNLAVVA